MKSKNNRIIRFTPSGSKNIVDLLIENGADVNLRDKESNTAMDYANDFGNF